MLKGTSRSLGMEPQHCHLPNEAILQVFSSLQGEDIENFTLACKRFYTLGEAVLNQHRSLKRRYGRIDNNNLHSVPQILSQSQLARYLRRLVVNGEDSGERKRQQVSFYQN
jgi:hypothetical protein